MAEGSELDLDGRVGQLKKNLDSLSLLSSSPSLVWKSGEKGGILC